MLLTPRVGHAFRSIVRQRGDEYSRERRVRIESDGEVAMARVRGSSGRSYAVEVGVVTAAGVPKLAADCECPHFERGEWCKHLWATLRTLERDGWSSPLLPAKATRLALSRFRDEDESFEEDLAGGDALDAGDVTPSIGAAVPAAAPRGRREPGPHRGWRAGIDALDRRGPFEIAWPVAPPALGSPAPLQYLIDADDVVRTQTVRLHFARRAARRDGEQGALMSAQLHLGEAAGALDAGERGVLSQLITLAQVDSVLRHGGSGYSSYANGPGRVRTAVVTVPMALLDPLLPRLAATGRLGFVPSGAKIWGAAAEAEPVPLVFDAGPAWQLRLRLAPRAGGGFELAGRFVRDGSEIAIDAASIIMAGGLIIAGKSLARADVAGNMSALTALRRAPLRIPERDLDAAIDRIASLPNLPELELAPSLPWRREPGNPRTRLRFDEIEAGRRTVDADLHFGYGAAWVAFAETRPFVPDRASRILYERDGDAEASAIVTLAALGVGPARGAGDARVAVAVGAFERVAQELLAKGWLLEVGSATLRKAGPSRASVQSGVDFFDLAGAVAYGTEEVPFPALLEAVQSGSRFVRLSDGSRGLLPTAWLARSAGIAALGEQHDGALRFSRAQVGFLAELVDAQDEARTDRRFAELRRKIARFDGIASVEAPSSFHGTLRPYQRDGLGWLGFLRDFGLGGCLADDMGLGKTVQVLAVLAGRRRSRGAPRVSLVVAPKSVVDGWVEEAARFAPKLRVLRYEGHDRASLREQLSRHDLVVTTYGTLLRDVEHLAKHRFDYAILDEAQAIKNAGSRTARAAKLLRAEHRLTLTGTPVENHLGELASQLEFLNPGMLGRARGFDALVRGRQGGEGVALLQRSLRPLLLRRTKEQVLADLPPKTEQTLFCDLDTKQRRDYDELKRHYQTSLLQRVGRDGIERSKIYVLEALLRLRQAACHPALLDPARFAESCAKLDLLYGRLEEVLAEGHKALVFSQFTSFLAEVRRGLAVRDISYAYLDGKTRDRRDQIARFESDPACKLFLISLKAGGTGLNLTAADYVFLLDPWWNPAVEAQAIDRTHRIGQTRPVFAYRLVARDTVEEKILALQERKRGLARSIFASEESFVAGLDADDLRLLLG